METRVAQPLVEEQVDRYVRTRNDVTTWMAETLDGLMRTTFEYTFDGKELYAEDNSAMGTVFKKSLQDAELMAAHNPILAFELRRRRLELNEYEQMLCMAKGHGLNTLIVLSDFPEELMHMTEDIGGYNVLRKQTMLRVLTWRDGRMCMQTQTLDGSNRQALENIYAYFSLAPKPGELLGQPISIDLNHIEQATVIDQLMNIYDQSLTETKGGRWYAGRKDAVADTYSFVCRNTDLVERMVAIELGQLTADSIDVVALLHTRFETVKNHKLTTNEFDIVYGAFMHSFENELYQAGAMARAKNKVFSGCGISMQALRSETDMTNQLNRAGYGNKGIEQSTETGACEYVHDGCYCSPYNADGSERGVPLKVVARRNANGIAHCLRTGCGAWLSSDGKAYDIGQIAKRAQKVRLPKLKNVGLGKNE